jgi:allantoate deiminase
MNASQVLARCDLLAQLSEEPDRLTRRFATPALAAACTMVGAWMQAAGMEIRRDAVGNLIGRYAGQHPDAKTILLGSHLDSVRDAGKYDGPLGVLVALACAERLHAKERRLPVAIEVVCFADEEGLRYHTAYLGSSAFAGRFDSRWLGLTDADGIELRDALRDFGGDPEAIPAAQRQRDDLLGYCEVHIEQGPVLESLDLPVGIVSAIAAQNRFALRFTGMAGHAGTTPMLLRRDALCAAAELVLAAERLAQSTPGLVATIGQLTVDPGASNVIPGQVAMSLDVRHQEDVVVAGAIATLRAEAEQIAKRRSVALDWQTVQSHGAVPCSPQLMELLGQSITALGYPMHQLPSGAGHDSVTLTHLTKVAMVFVRCKGGISHNPAESVTEPDVEVAIDVLSGLLERLGHQ